MIPSIQDIHIALARLRSRGVCFNPSMCNVLGDDTLAYAPPNLTVTHTVAVVHRGKVTNPSSESVVMQLPWDRTDWSIYEAIEAARKGNGKVYIEQDVIELGGGDPRKKDPRVPEWTRWVDQGFSVEVWPDFVGDCKYEIQRKERERG